MFRFRQFCIEQDRCAMKVGTDGVLLGAWAHGGGRILDVGTGTGILALMMAQRFSHAEVTALDIDAESVLQARQNVERSPFSRRVCVMHEPVQQHEGLYDAIVSNPPYFSHSVKNADIQLSMARHSVTLTYEELMASAWRLLSSDGELSVVVPFDYRQQMEDEAVYRGFFLHRRCAVSTAGGRPPRRYLLAFRKHPCQRELTAFTLGDAMSRRLTVDFYLSSASQL